MLKELERGQAIVEFAMICLLLIVVITGIIESARACYYHNALNYAAQEGVRFAVVAPDDLEGIRMRVAEGAADAGVTLQATPTISCNPCTSGWPITVSASRDFQPVVPLLPALHLQGSATLDIE